MGRLVEIDLQEGGSILVEVEDSTPGPVTRGPRAVETVTKAGETLEQVLDRLGPVVRGIVSQLRAEAEWPDEVEVEFGVKLSSDANAIIARVAAEANFRVALKWVKAGLA